MDPVIFAEGLEPLGHEPPLVVRPDLVHLRSRKGSTVRVNWLVGGTPTVASSSAITCLVAETMSAFVFKGPKNIFLVVSSIKNAT